MTPAYSEKRNPSTLWDKYPAYCYNRGQFSLRNLNAAYQKQLFPIPPLEFLQVPSPSPPLPLYNVDLGNADCRETVRDPPNNIELGGGGRGKYGRSIVYLSKRLEGYVFLTVLSTIVSANFFPFPQNSKSLNFPGAVDRHTGRCSLSYAYVNVSVLFSRDVTSQK